MSRSARERQDDINDLLSSCNYTTESRILQCINNVQTSFRSFKEYTTANQIPTRRVRVLREMLISETAALLGQARKEQLLSNFFQL